MKLLRGPVGNIGHMLVDKLQVINEIRIYEECFLHLAQITFFQILGIKLAFHQRKLTRAVIKNVTGLIYSGIQYISFFKWPEMRGKCNTSFSVRHPRLNILIVCEPVVIRSIPLPPHRGALCARRPLQMWCPSAFQI